MTVHSIEDYRAQPKRRIEWAIITAFVFGCAMTVFAVIGIVHTITGN